jgi:hypothetical protein
VNQLLNYGDDGSGGNALPYRRQHEYVPPFYPDRGEGTAACVLKLLAAAVLLIPAAVVLIVATSSKFVSQMSPVERASGFVALGLVEILLSLPSILIARRSIKPYWKRWKTTRLRGEQWRTVL